MECQPKKGLQRQQRYFTYVETIYGGVETTFDNFVCLKRNYDGLERTSANLHRPKEELQWPRKDFYTCLKRTSGDQRVAKKPGSGGPKENECAR